MRGVLFSPPFIRSGAHHGIARRIRAGESAMGVADFLSEIRACLHSAALGPDRDRRRLRDVEPCAENPDQHLDPQFDPTDYAVFQAVFGMIFTVIIALEFKRSLLVIAERVDSVVQVRAVLLIALLAVVRKLILLDLKATDALQLLALAASILALGAVYWMVRDQDRRRTDAKAAEKAGVGHSGGKQSHSPE